MSKYLYLTFILALIHTIKAQDDIYDQSPTLAYEETLYGPNYTPSVTGVAIGTAFYCLLFIILVPFGYWCAYHHGANAQNIKHNLLSSDKSQWPIFDRYCATKSFPYTLIFLNFLSFALYITAAIYDNWSYYSGPIYPVTIYFGIQNSHVNESGLGGVLDYGPLCNTLTTNNNVNVVCGLIRFGAAMTVVGYALALLTFFTTMVWLIVRHRRSVKAVAAGNHDPGLWSTRLLFIWHLNGLFQLITLLSWAIIAQVGLESLLNGNNNNEVMFTTCWWLLVGSTIWSIVPQLLARRSYMRHQYRLGTEQQQLNKVVVNDAKYQNEQHVISDTEVIV